MGTFIDTEHREEVQGHGSIQRARAIQEQFYASSAREKEK
jgi:hypothetical protein